MSGDLFVSSCYTATGPCHDWLCSYMAEFFMPYLRKYSDLEATKQIFLCRGMILLSMSKSENRQLSLWATILAPYLRLVFGAIWLVFSWIVTYTLYVNFMCVFLSTGKVTPTGFFLEIFWRLILSKGSLSTSQMYVPRACSQRCGITSENHGCWAALLHTCMGIVHNLYWWIFNLTIPSMIAKIIAKFKSSPNFPNIR